MESLKTGQLVKYIGVSGRADGPTGRVSRVCRAYVKVRWDDCRINDIHPSDLRAV
jgi:hypothetical protein